MNAATPSALPLRMPAVVALRALPVDDPACLVDLEVDCPRPEGHDLLVEVRAVSVNPIDTKVRSQRLGSNGEPRILGYDAAGVVRAVGAAVSLFVPGDEVYYAGSLKRPGSNARFQRVDERIVGRKPRALDFASAAALPLTTITAWETLFERMAIAQLPVDAHGRSLLVVGGAGGVGSMAIQLAKVLTGLHVIATASRPESAAWCRALGADTVVDHGHALAPQLQAVGRPAVDYVFCAADTDRWFAEIAEIVAPQGRLGFIVSSRAPLDMRVVQSKCVSLAWEMMFTRPLYGTSDMIEQHRLLDRVAGLVDAGRIRSSANEVLRPICAANLREAHRRVEAGRTIGKVVVEGWPD